VVAPVNDRIQHYVLNGDDEDLRRLLSISEVQAESARRAVRALGDVSGWRVLECGCGPLGSLAVFSELVGPAGHVTGIDFNPNAVERARSVLDALGANNVGVVVADINTLDRSTLGEVFDLAYTRAFLMHQVEPAATLRRVADLLNPDGVVIVQEPLCTPPPTSYPELPALGRYWDLLHQTAAKSGVAPHAVEGLISSALEAGFTVATKGGFFNVMDPEVGFAIHAGSVVALASQLTKNGVATSQEVHALERELLDASTRDAGWVTTPFMLELTLQKI
jgi:SAM-dependent methyltransferase